MDRAGAALHAEVIALAVRAEANVATIARARRDAAAAARAVASAQTLRDAALVRAAAATQPALAATIGAELARAQGRSDTGLWSWRRMRGTPARRRIGPPTLAGDRRRRCWPARAGEQRRARCCVTPMRSQSASARGLAEAIEALGRRSRIDLLSTRPAPTAPPERDDAVGLIQREREVLDQLALGRTNRQISEELFISVKTAGVHGSHILENLDVSTRGEAAAVARRLGLVA